MGGVAFWLKLEGGIQLGNVYVEHWGGSTNHHPAPAPHKRKNITPGYIRYSSTMSIARRATAP